MNDPPTHIWTRQLKFAGVSNTSTLYKRGIRVCTGTGLGAALSTCIQSPNWYLIWIGSDQEKTFGPTISSLIHRHIEPERLCLWDSKQRGGRPDVMKLVRDAYHSFGAEVVFITSNYQGNQEIMEGCKTEGIPAFVSLFYYARWGWRVYWPELIKGYSLGLLSLLCINGYSVITRLPFTLSILVFTQLSWISTQLSRMSL